MKVLIGFVLGVAAVLLLGAATSQQGSRHFVELSGDIASSTTLYQSAFSGINPEGECYLAITETQNGRTKVFKLTKTLDKKFSDIAFEHGKEGRLIVVP